MKHKLKAFIVLAIFWPVLVFAEYIPMKGDMIFQTSNSHQSRFIALATGSKFTHCGLVVKENTGWFILEAVGPVKETPLREWIARGNNGRFAVTRLKDYNKANINKVLTNAKKMIGRPYDIFFSFDDEKIYCSELIYRAYSSTGLELAKPVKLKELKIYSKEVKEELIKRYKGKIPYEQEMITPADLFNSNKVEMAFSNY